MSYSYADRKRTAPKADAPQTTAPETMDALMSGAVKPTAAMKGTSIDLDGAIRAKMEHAFGDLSAVKLYRSQAVADAGAEAIAQGNEIAFAPGMTDFSSRSGQERLGHELSHVMSQRSGRVRGQGFLANSALEAQADREGAMAAAGEQVYTGPVTHALSGAAPGPAAAGPMQASRGSKPTLGQLEAKENEMDTTTRGIEGTVGGVSGKNAKRLKKLREQEWANKKKSMSPGEFYDAIGQRVLTDDGLNGDGMDLVPKKYQDWFFKHQKKGSRYSGKEGWGTPEEGRIAEEAMRKKREQQEIYI